MKKWDFFDQECFNWSAERESSFIMYINRLIINERKEKIAQCAAHLLICAQCSQSFFLTLLKSVLHVVNSFKALSVNCPESTAKGTVM
jgi:hypothetical protein